MEELIKQYKAEFPETSSSEDEDEDSSDLSDEEREQKRKERDARREARHKAREDRRRAFIEKNRKARKDMKKEKLNTQKRALERGSAARRNKVKWALSPDEAEYNRRRMERIIKEEGLAFPDEVDPVFYGSFTDLESDCLNFRYGKLASGSKYQLVYRKRSEPLNVIVWLHNYMPEGIPTHAEMDIQKQIYRLLLWQKPFANNWVLATVSYRREGYLLADGVKDLLELRDYVIDYVIWDKLNDFGRAECQAEIDEVVAEKLAAVKKEEYFDAQDCKERLVELRSQLASIEKYYFRRRDRAHKARFFLYGEGMGGAISVLANERCRRKFAGVLAQDAALRINVEEKDPGYTYAPTAPMLFISNRNVTRNLAGSVVRNYVRRVKEKIAKLEDEEELEEIRQFQAAVRTQKGAERKEEKKNPNKITSKDVRIPSDWWFDRDDFSVSEAEVKKAFLGLYQWVDLGSKDDEKPPWPKGATVVLHSLVAKEHNGKRGTVRGYDARVSRYGVQLEDGSMFKLKKSNLKRIMTPTDIKLQELERQRKEEAKKKISADAAMTPDGKRAAFERDITTQLTHSESIKRKELQKKMAIWFCGVKKGPASDRPIMYKGKRGGVSQVTKVYKTGEIELGFLFDELENKLKAPYHADVQIIFNPQETKELRAEWQLYWYALFDKWGKQRPDAKEKMIWADMGVPPFAGRPFGNWVVVKGFFDGVKTSSERVIIKKRTTNGNFLVNPAAKELMVKEGDMVFISEAVEEDRLPLRCYDNRNPSRPPYHTQICGPGHDDEDIPRLHPRIEELIKLADPVPWVPTEWPDPRDPERKEILAEESSSESEDDMRDDPFAKKEEQVYMERKKKWDFDAVRPADPEITQAFLKSVWDQVNIAEEVPSESVRESILNVVTIQLESLRRVFMFYSASNYPVEFMSANQWLFFGTQTKIADRKDPMFSQIFVITNASDASTDLKNVQYDETNPDTMFTFSEFLEALIRVGCDRFPDERADKSFNKLVKRILKYAHPTCFLDFNTLFNKPEVWAVYKKYARKVYAIFAKYAADDKANIDSLSSMNIKEAFWFYQHSGIVKTSGLSRRTLITSFSMSQGLEMEDDSAAYEANYAEFIQILGRLANAMYPNDPMEEGLAKFLKEYTAFFKGR